VAVATHPLADVPEGHHRLKMALLKPAERNPRRGQIAAVVESLIEFGQHRDVVVQKATGQVIVGNHLFKAAQTLGWTDIDGFIVDDDDTKALRRAVADNATGDLASWEREELAEVLKEVGPVPGFGQGEFDKLLEDMDRKQNPQAPVFAITARFMEHYSYVVIVSTNETDDAWLSTKFDLRKEGSYKDEQVVTSRVLSVDRARDLLG
jgi:hypothetical protein